MNTVISLALLCVALIGSVFAAGEKFCVGQNPTCDFNCGNLKDCTQGCIGRKCPEMVCRTNGKCTQLCLNGCTSKQTCSAPICDQSCTGSDCEMECTSTVKTCIQTCSAGSNCTVSCDKETTDCQLGCENATCTGKGAPLPPPEKVAECDENTGKCTKSCMGVQCKETTLSCGNGTFTDCTLICNNGCTMECDSTVKRCNQTCKGNTLCKRVCKAHTCITTGAFHSSSPMVCRINYVLFAVFACVILFQ